MRRLVQLAVGIVLLAPAAHAEYAVLRSGQRLHITSYERAGTTIQLQLEGGSVELRSEEVTAIEPEDFFPALPKPVLDVPFAEQIRAASLKHGVDAILIASVIAVESNFNPRAISARSAKGLMQLLPETAARFQVTDVFNPAENIDAGTGYLKELLARFNQDLALALAAYNAGPDRVDQYRGVPPYSETRSYVNRVTLQLQRRKSKSAPHRSASNSSRSGVR